MNKCGINKCENPVAISSLCQFHYDLYKTKPEGKRGRPSVIENYYNSVIIPHEDKVECLMWPFKSKKGKGYANHFKNRKSVTVSRRICIEVHGNPPSDIHQAAHSCGRGHLGCVNPHHISWKTPTENNHDKWSHRTMLLGEKNPNTQLTNDKVLSIKRRLSNGDSIENIAESFKISRRIVRSIKTKHRWGWLQENTVE